MMPILLGATVKATIILTAAWAVTLVLRRSLAAMRHLVWCLALGGLLVLPIFSLLAPPWQVPLPAAVPVTYTVPQISTGPEPSAPARPDWVVRVWMAGALAVASRWLIGTVRVWRIALRARPISHYCGVALFRSDQATMPMVWGLWNPVILLPAEADQWPPERRHIVLMHELAHIERRDCWTQAMAQIVSVWYWFHPLVWFGAHRLREEREQACDDRVLRAGTKPSDYAGHLLDVARSLKDPSPAAVAMARRSQFEGRLLAILADGHSRQPVSARRAALVALAAAAVVVPLAALRPAPPRGVIAGTVYDVSGAVVPQAEVTISNLETGLNPTVSTDPAGEFRVSALPAGRYRLTVSGRGFRNFVRDVAVTESGESAHVDVVLQPGVARETIQVKARATPAANTAAAPGRPRRIRVGGNVQASKLLESRKPDYPERARAAGIEGPVLLRAVILINGNLSDPQVLSAPDPDLANAALDAVRQWRYQPTLLNGVPVEVETNITVNFELDGK